MADILILNGFVVTTDQNRRILKDGAVAISGNRIVDEEKVLDQAQEVSERIWKDYSDEYGQK